MSVQMPARLERWLPLALVGSLVVWLSLSTDPGKAEQGTARTGWEYREVEVEPDSVQATLEDMGQDDWEVFHIYAAESVINDMGIAKLEPHTFFLFAKRPIHGGR